MALFDAFLKIDGIDGESADAKHKGEIDVESWSWVAQQTGTHAHGSGGGAGKVSMDDVHFVMKTSKASPKLMLACASGQHIKKAVLTCRKAGGEQQEYLKVTFSDLLVSSYHGGGAGELIGLLSPAPFEAGVFTKHGPPPVDPALSYLLKWNDPYAASDKWNPSMIKWGGGFTLSNFEPAHLELPEGVETEIVPRDHISLNFSKVEFEYKEQKPDGSLGGTVKAGWDVKANKKV
jgi:type VI secretion system secreted protein Hcp